MYKNAADFSTVTDRIAFASNASFALRLKDETKTNADNHAIAGRDLHPSELQLIDAALEVDFPSPRKPDCSVVLHFENTNLPLQDQSHFVVGRLVAFLDNLAQAEKVPITALYDVIYRNVISRAGNSIVYDTLEALFEHKSLARDDIASLISRATNCQLFHAHWQSIAGELGTAGYGAMDQLRIHNAALQYLRERVRGDKRPNRFSTKIKELLLAEHAALGACKTMLDVTNMVTSKLTDAYGYDGEERMAALLVEISETPNAKK